MTTWLSGRSLYRYCLHHRLTLLLALLAVSFASTSQAVAANPKLAAYYFRVEHNGIILAAFKPYTARFDPTDEPWDGMFTSLWHRIDNSIPPDPGFGFSFFVPGFGVIPATPAKSDVAWDAHYAGCYRVRRFGVIVTGIPPEALSLSTERASRFSWMTIITTCPNLRSVTLLN